MSARILSLVMMSQLENLRHEELGMIQPNVVLHRGLHLNKSVKANISM